MEQIMYFGLIIICMALTFVVSAWIANFIDKKNDKKADNSQFNQDEFNAMNDEHFGDML